MRKVIMGVLAMAVMVGGVWGQTYWKKAYGGEYADEARAIIPTPDGNFIVAGDTYIPGPTGEDVYLLKIKPNGDTIWTKTYGGVEEDWASAIAPTQDGNFIVAGNSGTLRPNIYLLKIKPNGDTLWTKSFRELLCGAFAITPTSDGKFIVAGFYGNDSVNGCGVYLMNLKSDGDTVWTKMYKGCISEAFAITPTLDGNFLVAGYTASFGAGGNDVYLLKIKPNGDTLWTKTYGGSGSDLANAIIQTPDGNFVVAGYTSSFGAGNNEVYLLKIKPNGDALWTKSYSGVDESYAFAITPTQDGNFIVVGYAHSAIIGNEDVYLLKVKPNGDTVWTKTIGGSGGDWTHAITQTSDGNFIVAGVTSSFGSGNSDDVYLLSLIDDRYAYKNTLFTFKIPVSGDSLSHGYAALKFPSGMTVSPGGTISWTPKTDSVYMEHVEFLVSDDYGKKDTLTFNIFVNSNYSPTKAANPPSLNRQSPLPSEITIRNISPNEVRFSLAAGSKSLGIYDLRGQLLEKISVQGNQATWKSNHRAGKYFAKAIWEKREAVKPFVLIK